MNTEIVLNTQIVGNDTPQTMTSLEIAELTGKQHYHVMEAIRKMEPAWKKVCKSNFRLTSRTIVQPNGGTREVPCYQLTKTECLYIATKFNDEARAKQVLRRPELSQEENLKWASELLGVPYDEGAKDITRVFFTTTNEELLFLDDQIFESSPIQTPSSSPSKGGED